MNQWDEHIEYITSILQLIDNVYNKVLTSIVNSNIVIIDVLMIHIQVKRFESVFMNNQQSTSDSGYWDDMKLLYDEYTDWVMRMPVLHDRSLLLRSKCCNLIIELYRVKLLYYYSIHDMTQLPHTNTTCMESNNSTYVNIVQCVYNKMIDIVNKFNIDNVIKILKHIVASTQDDVMTTNVIGGDMNIVMVEKLVKWLKLILYVINFLVQFIRSSSISNECVDSLDGIIVKIDVVMGLSDYVSHCLVDNIAGGGKESKQRKGGKKTKKENDCVNTKYSVDWLLESVTMDSGNRALNDDDWGQAEECFRNVIASWQEKHKERKKQILEKNEDRDNNCCQVDSMISILSVVH